MNLYEVYPRYDYWCCYVFAETRNKARYALVNYFDDTKYIDFSCKLIKKDTGGKPEVCDVNCERLLFYNIQYSDYDY